MTQKAFEREELCNQPWRSLAGWFLGPKAENRKEFNNLALKVLDSYEDSRMAYQPTDPPYITEDIRQSDAYRASMNDLEAELHKMIERLSKSVPFFSPRYKGHMIWEVTLPSSLGYLAGMLWNQNNVDSSTSPVTTEFEFTVGNQLCEVLGFEKANDVTPWGHITSCGSIANIEALWAGRNLKFQPIALKNAINNDPRLQLLKEKFSVYVPRLDKEVRLAEAEVWDLMNLDIDDVCSMSNAVAIAAGINMKTLSLILEKFTIVSMGLHDFMKSNELVNTPVLFSPATHHYSWPKSSTLLGLGSRNLVPVPVDVNCRQNITELEKKLQECLDRKIPVITVVAIVGSTGESAVDPVEEILKLREKFRTKGLNFCIHVDAAWGGYLSSMLKEPTWQKNETLVKNNNVDLVNHNLRPYLSQKHRSIYELDFSTIRSRAHQMSNFKGQRSRPIRPLAEDGQDFVPEVSLSPYVTAQYQAIKDVETVTIDPHKAGLCVYPCGALCYRNALMRHFIALVAPEVCHGNEEPSVGVYGLEGSKPGAAAASVLLSHNVIGLDKSGYGRILGQCTYGAKLFYCMWMTVAKDDDPFVCINFIDSKPSRGIDSKKFIRERILGRTNKEVFQDKAVMIFLSEIGPDALINAFAVNLKNDDGSINTNIELTNQLQCAIFDELSGHVGMPTKRIPMFLTMSTLHAEFYGEALHQFKTRLSIEEDKNGIDQDLNFLRNTVLNPFQSSEGFVEKIGVIFRNTVLNCIGKLKDEPCHHKFVLGNLDKDGHGYCAFIPAFDHPGHQYDVVLKIAIGDILQISQIRSLQSSGRDQVLFIRSVESKTMFAIAHSKHRVCFDVWRCSDLRSEPVLTKIWANVEEIIRYYRLEPGTAATEYPLLQKYFLFGNESEAYLSHCVTKRPDFFQLIRLDEIPHSIPLNLLDLGVEVFIVGMQGRPLFIGGAVEDPLQTDSYTIQFRGTNDFLTRSSIKLHKADAKIWFQEIA